MSISEESLLGVEVMDEYLKDRVFTVYDDDDIATQVVRYDDVVKLIISLMADVNRESNEKKQLK